MYQANVYQVLLLLFSFLRQDVAVISMFSLDFSCSGKSESFFRTGISFNLWHLIKFLIIN